MKRYEGLFILDTAGKEDTVKDLIDKVSADITSGGGKVETVQKMDKRSFARVSGKKHTSGFYVNIIFESEPSNVAALRNRFTLSEDIFRVIFTAVPKDKPIAQP